MNLTIECTMFPNIGLAGAEYTAAVGLNLVVAWRESLCFSGKERATLKWAESVTLISKTHPPDEDHDFMKEHFSE